MLVTGVIDKEAAAQGQGGIPHAQLCPGTGHYSSTATLYIGPYATEEEATTDIPNAEQAALDLKEIAAESICPDNCSSPNQQSSCSGKADFDDQGATGVVIAGHNDWWVAVVVDINSTFTCNCDE